MLKTTAVVVTMEVMGEYYLFAGLKTPTITQITPVMHDKNKEIVEYYASKMFKDLNERYKTLVELRKALFGEGEIK